MTVTLSEKAAAFVEAQIQSGAFKTPEEVIDHAVTLERGREILAAYSASDLEEWLLEAADSPRTKWRGKAEAEEILEELRQRTAQR
jgi:Arc/MetJ-type ribon-helix-helix transcriptional regulator